LPGYREEREGGRNGEPICERQRDEGRREGRRRVLGGTDINSKLNREVFQRLRLS
jgi:hypothetical protein